MNIHPEETMKKRISQRRLRGVVAKAVLPKTITVRVERFFRHPRLERVVRRQKKFLVHDEKGAAQHGDEVVFEETRPLSRRKRWKLIEVTKRAPGAVEEAKEDTISLSDEKVDTVHGS